MESEGGIQITEICMMCYRTVYLMVLQVVAYTFAGAKLKEPWTWVDSSVTGHSEEKLDFRMNEH